MQKSRLRMIFDQCTCQSCTLVLLSNFKFKSWTDSSSMVSALLRLRLGEILDLMWEYGAGCLSRIRAKCKITTYEHVDVNSLHNGAIFLMNLNFMTPDFPHKVWTFWEAHKNLRNLPHSLYIYLVNVQTTRKIFFKFCVLLRNSKLYLSENLK